MLHKCFERATIFRKYQWLPFPENIVNIESLYVSDKQQCVKIRDTVSNIGYPNGDVPQENCRALGTFWFKLITLEHHASYLNM